MQIHFEQKPITKKEHGQDVKTMYVEVCKNLHAPSLTGLEKPAILKAIEKSWPEQDVEYYEILYTEFTQLEYTENETQ